MVLPIISYGHEMLTQLCQAVDPDDPSVGQLVDDMWETLRRADGAGLAAPQVDRSLQVFIVDSAQSYRVLSRKNRDYYFDGDRGIVETFINARITRHSDETWIDTEGCLSIPTVNVDVKRPWMIEIEYLDGDFHKRSRVFKGLTARMIQHEFDHTQGILFLEYLTSFKRALLKKQLDQIAAGEITSRYPMKFPG